MYNEDSVRLCKNKILHKNELLKNNLPVAKYVYIKKIRMK